MLKLFLSPILLIVTIILLPSIEKSIFLLPLFFALAVALVNLNKLKVSNKFFGVFLAIIQSYSVFLGLGVVVFFIDEFLQDISILNQDASFNAIVLITVSGYLAALLMFYFYGFLFRLDNKRFSYSILTIAYFIIVIVMQIFSKNEFLQFGVEKFTSYLISWVIFMSSAFNFAFNRSKVLNFIEK